MDKSGLFVFPSQEWQHNKTKLMARNEMYPIAKINAECQGSHVNLNDPGASLPKTLSISKNAKVMLSVNLCVQYGLSNGAMGIVRDIIYQANTKAPGLSGLLLVEFPRYTGPTFILKNPKFVINLSC